MTHSESLKELAAALAKAQSVMKGAAKDAENPAFRSRFASLSAVWDACREALTVNGLSVLQMPSADGNQVTVTTMLLHTSGECVSESLTMTARDASPQSIGSAITYSRRYGLAAMVGICPEDDDGEAATDHHAQPQRQRQQPQQQRPPGRGIDGGAGNGHTNPPRTGRALFAWIKDMEQRLDIQLLGFVNSFGKGQGWAPKMTEWDAAEVSRAHSEAMRHLREERSPDELGAEPDAEAN